MQNDRYATNVCYHVRKQEKISDIFTSDDSERNHNVSPNTTPLGNLHYCCQCEYRFDSGKKSNLLHFEVVVVKLLRQLLSTTVCTLLLINSCFVAQQSTCFIAHLVYRSSLYLSTHLQTFKDYRSFPYAVYLQTILAMYSQRKLDTLYTKPRIIYTCIYRTNS